MVENNCVFTRKFQKEELYFHLLYQISNNLNLIREKKKTEQLKEYLREIFEYSNDEHKSFLKKIQDAEKPTRCCNITISHVDGLDVCKPDESTELNCTKYRFYITACLSSAQTNGLTSTSIQDKFEWNELLRL